MSLRSISILGLGLLGGSVGLATRERVTGIRVMGYDLSAEVRRRAIAVGAIDEAAGTLAEACVGADLVVVCVPLGVLGGVIREAAGFLQRGTVVTDVSSTKRSVVKLCETLLPEGVPFVGAHPMAGAEVAGIESARATLFHGANCLLTPTLNTPKQARSKVEWFWQTLGMQVRMMSPECHDELVAQISHLPHVIASALVRSVAAEAMSVAGPGFRDTTRVAAAEAMLWRDILRDNADEVRRALSGFRNQLDQVEALLEADSAESLRDWLNKAAELRRGVNPGREQRP